MKFSELYSCRLARVESSKYQLHIVLKKKNLATLAAMFPLSRVACGLFSCKQGTERSQPPTMKFSPVGSSRIASGHLEPMSFKPDYSRISIIRTHILSYFRFLVAATAVCESSQAVQLRCTACELSQTAVAATRT